MELTLTIQKSSILTAKRQFVAVPYDEYKLLLKLKKKLSAPVRLTASQKERISKSEQELARGEYSTLDTLSHELLGSTHPKTRRKKS